MGESDEVFMQQECSAAVRPNPNQTPKGLYREFPSHTHSKRPAQGQEGAVPVAPMIDLLNSVGGQAYLPNNLQPLERQEKNVSSK